MRQRMAKTLGLALMAFVAVFAITSVALATGNADEVAAEGIASTKDDGANYKLTIDGSSEFQASIGQAFKAPHITVTADTPEGQPADPSIVFIGVRYPNELYDYGFNPLMNPPIQARAAGSAGPWYDFSAMDTFSSFGLASPDGDEFCIKEGVPAGTRFEFFVCVAPRMNQGTEDNPYLSYADMSAFQELGTFTCVVDGAQQPAPEPEPAPEPQPSSVVLFPSSLTLEEGGAPATVAVGGVGDGALGATSSDESVATVGLDGTTLTVTPVGIGECTVAVSRAATGAYGASEAALAVTVGAGEEPGGDEGDAPASVEVWRLCNTSTGEHLYTTDRNERDTLAASGAWASEGRAWDAPEAGEAVYRLYNPYADDHLYTCDAHEAAQLTGIGWQADNGGDPVFHSGGDVDVYRLFNPYSGRHLITCDANEYEVLGSGGWDREGVKLHAVS